MGVRIMRFSEKLCLCSQLCPIPQVEVMRRPCFLMNHPLRVRADILILESLKSGSTNWTLVLAERVSSDIPTVHQVERDDFSRLNFDTSFFTPDHLVSKAICAPHFLSEEVDSFPLAVLHQDLIQRLL